MITILGRIPSKKNSRIPIVIRGRSVSIPNNKYRIWHKDASTQLLWLHAIPTPTTLTISFWFPDKRKTDLTNKAESIMDLLVDNGIIADDNYLYIPTLILRYAGLDRDNPRAEITWETENKFQ